jgi:anti-anti-sigma factor
MAVSVSESEDKQEITLHVPERFDFSCHQEFTGAYKAYPKGETRFVVDLGHTEYMDSSAMGMLLQLREHSGNAGPIALTNAGTGVREILRIANFDKLFSIS